MTISYVLSATSTNTLTTTTCFPTTSVNWNTLTTYTQPVEYQPVYQPVVYNGQIGTYDMQIFGTPPVVAAADHEYEETDITFFDVHAGCRHCDFGNPDKFNPGAHRFLIEEEADLLELLAA